MDTCDVDIRKGRRKILTSYISELSKAKFAVTDRLHGMILCYITNTPCFVFGINNPKIESTVSTWLNNQNIIKYIKNADELGFMPDISDDLYKEDLIPQFDNLKAIF